MLATSITNVAEAHGVRLVGLPRASELTDRMLTRFTNGLERELAGQVPGQLDVVLFGSFGRQELTSESDCDYLVLLEGMPQHSDIKRVVTAVEKTRDVLMLGKPGSTGTFGDFVTATELFARIGLEGDSNANTTRRLLLLSESVSVLRSDVTDRIRSSVVERYLGDYAPDVDRQKPVRLPHFLLNDVMRYWRTIAVDFGAKQWRSLASDWYLRYAKLLTTRKILFAGTLAVLLDSVNVLAPLYDQGKPDRQVVFGTLKSHIVDGLAQTPLARLMSLHDRLAEPSREALATVLRAYDGYIELLDDRFFRSTLVKGGVDSSDMRAQVEETGQTIHEALLVLFHDDPLFRDATRQYGVF